MHHYVNWLRHASRYINAHRAAPSWSCCRARASRTPNFANIVHDLVLLHSLGVRLVLVHGSRPQIGARGRPRPRAAFPPAACAGHRRADPGMRGRGGRRPAWAGASRHACRWTWPPRRCRARGCAWPVATWSPRGRSAWSTASTTSTPARCGASTARASSACSTSGASSSCPRWACRPARSSTWPARTWRCARPSNWMPKSWILFGAERGLLDARRAGPRAAPPQVPAHLARLRRQRLPGRAAGCRRAGLPQRRAAAQPHRQLCRGRRAAQRAVHP